MADKQQRVVVIGGGPGGYPAAFLCADRGMDVTLIDTALNPGGVCLYRGCIPSKALLHAAKVLDDAREASLFGVDFPQPEIDLERLRAFKNDVVTKLTGGLGQLSQARRVKRIQGRGAFAGDHRVAVTLQDGSTQTVEYDVAILSTGSVPVTLDKLFPKSDLVMDSTVALDVPDVPGTLLVVGGGYIGLELGSVYSALGSQVTVVEATGGLLPGVDRDLVRILEKRLRGKLHEVLLDTKVTGAELVDSGVKVTMVGLDLENPERVFDKVLVAVGRRPNSANLGLEHTGVELDHQGFVKIDASRRTNDPDIFAIGDVAGQPMLAHKATYEAKIVAEVLSGEPAVFDAQAIPAVVFTDPEIAWAGLTETEAQTTGRQVKISRFPWEASGRATTLGRNDGLTKLLTDPRTERVLGVGICGVSAGEMIAEAVLAIELGARATDLQMSIHAHPTLSETVMEAGELFFGQSPHLYQRARS